MREVYNWVLERRSPLPSRVRERTVSPARSQVARSLACGAILLLTGCTRANSGTIPGDPPLGYVEVGAGSPTIVVLHRGPGVIHDYLRREWDRLAPNSRVIYYDQRGCGQSGRAKSYTWRDHVADLDRVLRTRAPGERVVVAGSSWGAHLALLYTLEHPDRVQALVLSGLVPWAAVLPDSSRAYTARVKRTLPSPRQADSLMRAQMDSLMRMSPEAEAAHRREKADLEKMAAELRASTRDMQRLEKRLTQCPDARDATLQGLSPAPPMDRLRATRVPTLIVRGGRRDHVEDGAPAVARLLPNGHMRTIPGAGHDPWFSRPDLFFALIDSFVAR